LTPLSATREGNFVKYAPDYKAFTTYEYKMVIFMVSAVTTSITIYHTAT
jgi:hypothetical protein